MKYTIIEDCSPFYIRFTHDGIDDLIDYCKKCTPKAAPMGNWLHYNISSLYPEQSEKILSMVPLTEELEFQRNRVSLFISGPGLYYRAHKDGNGDRFSINYTVSILDDKCQTSWYSDEDLQDYKILGSFRNSSRECLGFDRTKHIPIKTMVAKPNECILFNTEIFHDWNNSPSTNTRTVLTLRHVDVENVYFEDARKLLFGY